MISLKYKHVFLNDAHGMCHKVKVARLFVFIIVSEGLMMKIRQTNDCSTDCEMKNLP